MGRECSTNGDKRNAYRILLGKPEGKRPLGRFKLIFIFNCKWVFTQWQWYLGG
jgi:hypothetical protein